MQSITYHKVLPAIKSCAFEFVHSLNEIFKLERKQATNLNYKFSCTFIFSTLKELQ